MKETILCSAFPGCGKSHYFKNTELDVLDSDSSTFDKSEFPQNYMEHIKENIGKVDVILISSHDVVRDALTDLGYPYLLVYPDINSKEEYLKRYVDRGNDDAFVKLLDQNWETWLTDLANQPEPAKHCVLRSGEFLSEVLP
jgi:hypothetical protein